MDNENKSSRIQNMNDIVNGNIDETDEIRNALDSAESESAKSFRISRVEDPSDAAEASRTSSSESTVATTRRRSLEGSSGRTSGTSSQRSTQQRRTTKTSSGRTSQKSSSGASSQRSSSGTQRRQSSGSTSRQAQTGARRSSSASRTNQSSSASYRRTNTTAANRRYSDIANERRASAADTAGQRNNVRAGSKKKESKKSRFGKALIIYSALLVVILAVGGLIFRSYIKSYEEAQPQYAIEEIVGKYKTSANLSAFINGNSDKIQCLDDFDTFVTAYTELVNGKTISYMEDSDNTTEENPAYILTADGTIVANIVLCSSEETGSWGRNKWEIETLDIVSCYPDAKSYSVLAPEGSTVTVNGITLGDSYVTGTGVPEILENSVDYIEDVPEFTTYSITILTGEPEVTVTDASGEEMTVTASDSIYAATTPATDEFIESVDTLVQAGIREWAYYFIHMSQSLSLYIVEGSDLYVSIFGDDENQGIQTDLYNYEQIASYEFEVKEATNYIVYTDDCFTVDVRYKLDMQFTEGGMSDDNQLLHATWVWVRDGDSWSISDEIVYSDFE